MELPVRLAVAIDTAIEAHGKADTEETDIKKWSIHNSYKQGR